MLMEESKREEDTRLPSARKQLLSDLTARFDGWEEEKERLMKFYQGEIKRISDMYRQTSEKYHILVNECKYQKEEL